MRGYPGSYTVIDNKTQTTILWFATYDEIEKYIGLQEYTVINGMTGKIIWQG